MSDGYAFNPSNVNKITLTLLIGIFAQQQYLCDVLAQDRGLSKDQVLKGIALKEKELLDLLYTQFGLTPDVISPEKD